MLCNSNGNLRRLSPFIPPRPHLACIRHHQSVTVTFTVTVTFQSTLSPQISEYPPQRRLSPYASRTAACTQKCLLPPPRRLPLPHRCPVECARGPLPFHTTEGFCFVTRAPLGGAESVPLLDFLNNSKTVADIDTKFGVPYPTSI